MHTAFLFHGIQSGMDMAIVNAGQLGIYDEIPNKLLGYIEDVLLNRKEIKIYKNKKIKTKNTHGTGCTLSSAITTFFACGKNLNKSCELGIKYVNQSIRSNLNYGKGHGPINHLSSIKINRIFN